MRFLPIFQTSIFWVRKIAKIAIFVNFLAARAQPERAEFRFNDLKRKIVTKWLQIGYKMVTPEIVTKWLQIGNKKLQIGYKKNCYKTVTNWLQNSNK